MNGLQTQNRGGVQSPAPRPTVTGSRTPTPTPTPTATPVVVPASGTTCSDAIAQSPGSTYNRLPDTTNGIYAFIDQPSGLPSDAVIQFMTNNRYAGTQKMTCQQKNHFLAQNANWVQLHYRLANASGSAPYIHNNTWSSDWTDVSSHEDWFLHNPQNERLSCTVWNWAMHDVTNASFRNYWVNSVLADIAANNSDGVFADSFDSYALLDMQNNPSADFDDRLAATHAADPSYWTNGYTLSQQYNDFVTFVQGRLHASPRSPLYIPNVDALNTFWWVSNLNLSQLDGAFLEGAPVLDSDWLGSGNNILTLTRANKVVIFQRSVSESDANSRFFIVGTYLLLKGTRTYLNMMAGNGGNYSISYWPEYGIDLGAPTAALPSTLSNYASQGAYRRDFQKGTVLVNPSSANVTYTLAAGDPVNRVSASGGGALDDSTVDSTGSYHGGSLGSAAVTSGTVTLAPWSAIVLLYNPL